ncbi:rho GTPase-activating protein 6 isoform X3 [Lepus europaeus]|uniref:rho GTPase-activating protein 6 isoform X3 n=1 Tax=Lepus europaeus TaxID=9983 RepID=UPI002B4737E8|nr:rho GTPase-activating protein 6 isoform X3 [Lepus europaeus]
MGAPAERTRLSPGGDFTWHTMSGRAVRLRAVPIQSLSELERARLQEVAFSRLQQEGDLSCPIAIPKGGRKRKSLRKKLDSLGKEKTREGEPAPRAFGMTLSQVIANDRAHRRRREEPAGDPAVTPPRPRRDLSGSSSSLSSAPDTPTEAATPGSPEAPPRARRRGAVSVDSITDLDEDPSRLLEALQLSLPTAAPGRKDKARAQRLSLNPVCRQVPRLVDSCCDHLERHGLRTVGIFRVGSSKKRVRQLRAEFDRGAEVALEAERSAHDVAALLKEFLRDMAEPLLTRELYAAFIDTLLLEPGARLGALRLLVCLLPPCNCDTLRRLLHFLALVARHAQDHVGRDGREVPGNKMTSLNLATIFGPNLLHKQKSSDREFSVQSPARAEESTAVIAVVKEMIENHEALFMVPPALQNEVLLSLLETDPDVVDYLLRRKAAPPTDPPGTAPSPQASPELPDRPRQPAESGEGPHIWETGSLRPRPRPLTLDWPRRPRSLGDPDPGRAEPRPPPPYPGPREPPGGRGRQDLGAGAWLDWRRERWEIWELLSGDGPDALPETLV